VIEPTVNHIEHRERVSMGATWTVCGMLSILHWSQSALFASRLE